MAPVGRGMLDVDPKSTKFSKHCTNFYPSFSGEPERLYTLYKPYVHTLQTLCTHSTNYKPMYTLCKPYVHTPQPLSTHFAIPLYAPYIHPHHKDCIHPHQTGCIYPHRIDYIYPHHKAIYTHTNHIGYIHHTMRLYTPTPHMHTKGRDNITIGTWNTRTLRAAGKLQELTHEMDRYRWNILGLCEMRWTKFCETTTEKGHKFFCFCFVFVFQWKRG